MNISPDCSYFLAVVILCRLEHDNSKNETQAYLLGATRDQIVQKKTDSQNVTSVTPFDFSFEYSNEESGGGGGCRRKSTVSKYKMIVQWCFCSAAYFSDRELTTVHNRSEP